MAVKRTLIHIGMNECMSPTSLHHIVCLYAVWLDLVIDSLLFVSFLPTPLLDPMCVWASLVCVCCDPLIGPLTVGIMVGIFYFLRTFRKQ